MNELLTFVSATSSLTDILKLTTLSLNMFTELTEQSLRFGPWQLFM